jgi:hypothetical protein
MKFIYPADYFNIKKVDEFFEEEALQLKNMGFSVSIMNGSPIEKGEYLYRGWMLSEEEYDSLNSLMLKNDSTLITNKINYFNAHYLSNWYDILKDYTPETVITSSENLPKVLAEMEWSNFFIKDFVKSLTTSEGSIANSKEEVLEVIKKIEDKKGITGGICLRKVEDFITESEIRYFSINGQVISPTNEIPDIVNKINSLVNLPFFSIDIIKDRSGKDWLVEIGDGQVSDLKSPWTTEKFAQKIKDSIKKKVKNKALLS